MSASPQPVSVYRPSPESVTEIPKEPPLAQNKTDRTPWFAQKPSPRPSEAPLPKKSPGFPSQPIKPPGGEKQGVKRPDQGELALPKSNAPANTDSDPDEPPPPVLRNQQLPKTESFPRITLDDVTATPAVEFTVQAPARKPVGAQSTFQLAVRNAGDHPQSNLVVRGRFDKAFVFPGSDRREVMLPIDRMSPGEIREIPLTLTSDVVGAHCCWFTVSQKENADETEIISKQVCVDYVLRQVDIEIVGPTQRTTGSRAEFNASLTNTLSRAIVDAQVVVSYDKALYPKELSTGAEQKPGTLTWRVGTLMAGERIQLQMEFECKAPAHRALLAVELQEGGKTRDSDEACLEIVPVRGTLDLRIKNGGDPVEVGKTGTYEASIENIGLQPALELQMEMTASEHWRIVSASVRQKGTDLKIKWKQEGNILKFDPIDQLEPAGQLTFVAEVEALRSGVGEMRANLTSSLSSTPVTTAEPTSIVEP